MNDFLAGKAIIRYADFLRICHVQHPTDFAGFKVNEDGLYVILPDLGAMITFEERAVLSWHPTGHYEQPALRLPCTLDELQKFFADAELPGCIEQEALAEVLASQNAAETPQQRRARLLDWFEAESKLEEHGAVQRVFEREEAQNPRADRSNVGKDIKKAQIERTEQIRGGAWSYQQLVKDGKRTR